MPSGAPSPECRYPDVIVVGMSPDAAMSQSRVRYHLGAEAAGCRIQHQGTVLNAGQRRPSVRPQYCRGGVIGAYFGLTEKEVTQIEKHKVAILHHGNVRSHVVAKVRYILEACDVKAIVVSQSPIDYEDLAKEGVKTAVVMPPAQ